jgi:phospholipid/cholesterol/gamma-HCH transport system substrate-binding protein
MRPSLFDQLQNQGLSILQQTENIAQRLNGLLTPQNEQTIIGAFANVSNAATRLADIPEQLEPTLGQLPRLTTQAEQTLRSMHALTSQLQQANGPLDKLAAAAEDVSDVANRLENETQPLAGDVRSSLRALSRTLESLNERPQSVLFGSPEARPGPGEPGFADAEK